MAEPQIQQNFLDIGQKKEYAILKLLYTPFNRNLISEYVSKGT
jgi:hypothetical protein